MISSDQQPAKGRLGGWAWNYGVGGLLVLGLPWLLELLPGIAVGYVLYLVCLGLIYAIVALGLNLLVGYAGQFSLVPERQAAARVPEVAFNGVDAAFKRFFKRVEVVPGAMGDAIEGWRRRRRRREVCGVRRLRPSRRR